MDKPHLTPPHFLDLTLPEGGYRVHHQVLPEQAAALAQNLARAGLTWMEVCHGRGIGAYRAGYPGLCHDRELLEAVKQAAPQLQRSVSLRALPYCLEALEDLQELFQLGRITVVPSEFSKIQDYVASLKKFGKTMVCAARMRVLIFSASEPRANFRNRKILPSKRSRSALASRCLGKLPSW